MEALEILSASRLFGRMDPRHLEKLASIAEVRALIPGDRLTKQGADDQSIQVLGTGGVKVLKEHSDGEEDEVARLGSGATLGEVSFVDRLPRSTTVMAVERTFVAILPPDKLKKLVKSDPVLRASVYWRFSVVLAHRLRGATKNIASLKAVLEHH